MQDSLQQALRELVDRIAGQVRTDQVIDAFLAGGVATYMHLQQTGGPAAEAARYSEDVDLHFVRSLVLHDVPVVAYRDRNGGERMLALDGSYTIDIGLRHPDCLEDAEFLFASSNGRVRLFLLSALDLAVTKTGRFQDHDRADIESLARAGLLEAEAFRERATEALDYLATDPAMVRINIDEAAELITASSSSAPARM